MISNEVKNEIKEISSELINVVFETGAYNPKTQFINIDNLWQLSENIIKVSNLISEYLSKVVPIENVKGLISIDNVIYPFGPIPISSLVCAKLNLPLGIWKENDDPITGEHRIFGITPNSESLILYDVTRFGLTALRMLVFLHDNGICPKWFVTIIDCGKGAKELLLEETLNNMGFEMEFMPLLKLKDISNAYDYRFKDA
jgi:orotate phosphoribosyltransferase